MLVLLGRLLGIGCVTIFAAQLGSILPFWAYSTGMISALPPQHVSHFAANAQSFAARDVATSGGNCASRCAVAFGAFALPGSTGPNEGELTPISWVLSQLDSNNVSSQIKRGNATWLIGKSINRSFRGILHLTEQHFVVILGCDQTGGWIVDPANWTIHKLNDSWLMRWSGIVVVVEPSHRHS